MIGTIANSLSFKPFMAYLSVAECEYKWMFTYNALEKYSIENVKLNNEGTLAAFATDVRSNKQVRSIIRTSDGTNVYSY